MPSSSSSTHPLTEALALHRDGELGRARAAYEAFLATHPDQPDALNLLGVLHHQQGDAATAVRMIGRAVERAPDFAAARSNLGSALMELGRLDEAAAQLTAAADLEAADPLVRVNLSNAQRALGRLADAAATAIQAIRLAPDLAAAHIALGRALAALTLFDDAERHFRVARDLDPDDPSPIGLLADTLEDAGRTDAASTTLQDALRQHPDSADLHGRLGALRTRTGDIAGGVKHLSQAARLEPERAARHNDLGLALLRLNLPEQAARCFETALTIDPNDPAGLVNLGGLHRQQGDLTAAEAAYRRALVAHPGLVPAAAQLGSLLFLDLGDANAAVEPLRRAAEASAPESPHASAALLVRHYADTVSGAEIAAAHAAWGRAFPSPPRPPARRRGTDEALRVGFLSADFRSHATGVFLPPLLRHRDAAVWTAHLFSNTATSDATTDDFRRLADAFTDVTEMDDDTAAECVRDAGIDVLIDLNGHTLGHRLGVLARRPAAIQATWMDYVGSTGLAQVDAVLADARHVTSDMESQYVETVLRFPDNLYVLDPPRDAPDPAPPPCGDSRPVTFGCFNAAFKLGPANLDLWARVLARVADSRLLLRSPPFANRQCVTRFRALFKDRGIDPDRIAFHGPLPNREMLAAYRDIDIALDSRPYSGGLTTLEALWMGIPVITLPGDRMAARHAAAHLWTLGADDLVASDEDGYVDIAAALATDRRRLADLHATLRPRLAASPLTDGAAQTRAFEALLSEMLARFGG